MTKFYTSISHILNGPRWKRHLLGWVVYAMFFYIDEIGHALNGNATDWIAKTTLFLTFMGLIYVVFFLYDITFQKNKVILFVIGCCLAIVVFKAFQYLLFNYVFGIGYETNLFVLLPAYIYTVVMVSAIKYGKDMFLWQQLEIEKKERQNELERNFLLAQISPHFLFNTLNNLYGHAVQKSDSLPDMMIRLSDLLRYTVYEASKPFVPLRDELAYIQNYVELEQMRLSKHARIKFTFPTTIDNSLQIAPLLLISFVENAFKHSRHTIDKDIYINGDISMKGNKLFMQLENSYNSEVKESSLVKREGGIGLGNVKKRLQLFYLGKHHLHIKETHGIYILSFELDL